MKGKEGREGNKRKGGREGREGSAERVGKEMTTHLTYTHTVLH